MVMGADGLGRIEGISALGSTTLRTLRHGKGDLLIAKKSGEIKSILAGVDGSEQAFLMIKTAASLARTLGATLILAAAFDPGLHRTVFGSLSATLSKEAGNAFKFSEQEGLHNEIIDRSLAELYSRHLEHAAKIAHEAGVMAEIQLAEGKPFHVLCTLAEEIGTDLIVIGHSGMHRSEYSDIGSNTERIAERAKTNVLVVRNTAIDELNGEMAKDKVPNLENCNPISSQAEIIWSDDAKKRLENVPGIARSMAVMAIERYAKEHKIIRITPEIMSVAREKLGT